jgi:phosphatidylethanolamine/phosphatidyl-N-methylethanolamine N-methyltransferase
MNDERLDDAAVVAAYARWAPIYDPIFGFITGRAIRATMTAVNALVPGRILEVGVGTGLALPLYKTEHRIVGIDLSPDMLRRAEKKVAAERLANIEGLAEMDAANLAFPDAAFDAAVAMFVMTVVPDAPLVLAEIVRVVKPGGRIVIVNHFSADSGLRAATERWLSRFASSLGWHPEFAKEQVLGCAGMKLLSERSLSPFGLYTLLVFERVPVL